MLMVVVYVFVSVQGRLYNLKFALPNNARWLRQNIYCWENKVKRGFGLLAQATKPSETRGVHWGGHPYKY